MVTAEQCRPGDACLVIGRGPNWLFVRIATDQLRQSDDGSAGVAEQLWGIATRHFVYRIVLEMDEVEALDAASVAGLRDVRDRLVEHGGALRLCGLSDAVAEQLLKGASEEELPNHGSWREAVIGAARSANGDRRAAPRKAR